MESFNLIEFLGKGTYGFTFSGIHKMLKTKCAIKFLEISEEEMMDKIICEIKTINIFRHPNIINFDKAQFLKKEKSVAIFMELADNSLSAMFKSLEQLTAIKYFIDLCHGLDYLHKNHFVHRNLKPTNILIKNNVAKITDFGIIKQNEKNFIPMANYFGTESYISPELLKGEKYSEKSDIWALGIIFHQMLTKGDDIFKFKEKNEDLKLKILNSEIVIHPNIAKIKKLDIIIRGNFI